MRQTAHPEAQASLSTTSFPSDLSFTSAHNYSLRRLEVKIEWRQFGHMEVGPAP